MAYFLNIKKGCFFLSQGKVYISVLTKHRLRHPPTDLSHYSHTQRRLMTL